MKINYLHWFVSFSVKFALNDKMFVKKLIINIELNLINSYMSKYLLINSDLFRLCQNF